MKETILTLLLAAFAGVRKDGLNHLAGALALQVKTEEEAKEVVGTLTADEVNHYVTEWRKEADAEITKANKTYEDGLKKKYDFVEKKAEEGVNPTPPATGSLDEAQVKKMIDEAAKDMADSMIQREAEKETKATRRKMVEEALADVPVSYKAKVLKDYDRMAFTDEDSFTNYLNDTKTDVANFGQELADRGLGNAGKPMFGNDSGKEASQQECDAIADKMKV